MFSRSHTFPYQSLLLSTTVLNDTTAAGVPYEVVVVALTSAGRGAKNDFITFFSQQLTPTRSPDNINIQQLNSTTINITWTPLTLFEARGFPVYRVVLTPEDNTNRRKRQSNTNSMLNITTTNSFAVFTDLNENTSYSTTVGVRTNSTSSSSEFVEASPIRNGMAHM